MDTIQAAGKVLVLLGVVMVLAGAALILFNKLPFLGKLPGDIHITRENFQLFIPITTSIVISVLVSAVLWLIAHFRGK